MARIALDAMGGDRAPVETVAGAVAAFESGHDVVLVGDEVQLKPVLAELGSDVPVVQASQVISMGDDPARAIREKADASVVVAARLVAEGDADGFVSAGSTGGALAAATIILGRLPNVLRPAIATILPTPGRPTVLVDSGANPDCRPEHLAQFGVMGAILAEVYLDLTEPRVGLLNIGEEPGKGRDLERAAYDLLKEGPTHFVGNVEGHDIVTAKADVIVTDGFTGNILLKTSEGTARFVATKVLEALSVVAPEDLARLMPLLSEVRAQIDFETFGGAHLVGAKGTVVIAHGSSTRVAITNALSMADDGASHGLVEQLSARVAQVG
jgi:glycerol-3-phosphate acyltransferase PlsX